MPVPSAMVKPKSVWSEKLNWSAQPLTLLEYCSHNPCTVFSLEEATGESVIPLSLTQRGSDGVIGTSVVDQPHTSTVGDITSVNSRNNGRSGRRQRQSTIVPQKDRAPGHLSVHAAGPSHAADRPQLAGKAGVQ